MAFFDFYPMSFKGHPVFLTSPEALAELSYESELELKNSVFSSFCSNFGLPEPEKVIPSPKSREYRSTGKRRISFKGGRVFLHFGRIPDREAVTGSRLEPPEYLRIYQLVQQELSHPRAREAALAANYCIIRGGEQDRTLILNVRRLSAPVIRSLRFVAEKVKQEIPSVRSVSLYVDETDSDYYLEAERPEGKLGWKKLFGPEKLSLKLPLAEPKKFLYSPTVFSQINESILPDFASVLEEKAALRKNDLLLDLYCGYGLWSLILGSKTGSVWGAELSAEAIHCARENAGYHYPGKSMRFEVGNIDADYLRKALPPQRYDREVILLDPPRKGTGSGVLETLIARHPRRIIHVFCGVDELPSALKIYTSNGCRIESLIPFDFFPGTLNLEVMAVAEPKKQS